jgi:hypothetical protein
VTLIQVHVIEAQPSQTAGNGFHDVLAGKSLPVLALHRAPAQFGGDDEFLARDAANGLAEQNFGLPRRVDVGRIEQVDAFLERVLDDLGGVGFGNRAAPRDPAAERLLVHPLEHRMPMDHCCSRCRTRAACQT